jgi:hypothetical protein
MSAEATNFHTMNSLHDESDSGRGARTLPPLPPQRNDSLDGSYPPRSTANDLIHSTATTATSSRSSTSASTVVDLYVSPHQSRQPIIPRLLPRTGKPTRCLLTLATKNVFSRS